MPNPEQGPEGLGEIGTWQTVSLEVPDFLEPVRQTIDAFFSFLIQILNILLTVLEILKVFATGLLDPLIALIEAIKNLIEALLNDLRQLGIYIHGDFYALEGPDFAALKGGYTTFEGRMAGRLQDTQDPNRPDISASSTCIAVFLFVQTDIRGINRIVQLIKSILGLFNRQYPLPRMQNQVSNVQATYGYDGATIFSFNKSFFRGFDFKKDEVQDNIFSPYNAVNLTWQMSPIPGAPFPDTPVVPPAGFLVEFATMESPLRIVGERVIQGSAQDMDLPNQPAKTEVFELLDADQQPIRLRGGVQQLDIKGRINWNDAVGGFTGEFKSDAVRVYGIRHLNDRSPIALDLLQEGDKYFLQKTFYVPFGQNLFFPGKGYGATFLFEDMPYSADFDLSGGFLPGKKGKISRTNDTQQPERYFVRVRAVNKTVKSAEGYQFEINTTTLRSSPSVANIVPGPSATDPVDFNDAGPPSELANILFPDASTQLYLRALAEALAVMALSRADVPVLLGLNGSVGYPPSGPLKDGTKNPYWETYQDRANKATQLEEVAKFLMVQVVGRRQVRKFFEQTGTDPAVFRKKLFINCINLTNRMLTQNLPPLAARQLAVERAQDLLNFKILFDEGGYFVSTDPNEVQFSDAFPGGTPLDLLQDNDSQVGIGPNPSSLGIAGGRAADKIAFDIEDQTILARDPHFFFAQNPNAPRGRGSVDSAPVVYNRTNNQLNKIDFFRNLVPDSVYEGAAFVLQVAAGPAVRPQERGWIAFRAFPQGLPSIDRFFDQILSLLRSIQAAIESIAETIVRYIEFLQSRIRELQAFLNRLNALIQRLLRFFFSITPAAGLIVVAPGTDGVTTALLASQNKPIGPPNPESDSYGGGIVLLAGGIPNLAIDVFRALFKGDG